MTSDSSKSARALASRRNGARSRGPKTAAGKARVARNALKHGLSARRLMLLDDEDAAAYAAFERAAYAELAPTGEFQADLVARMVSAAWRARRADRLEAGVLRYQTPSIFSTNKIERREALSLGLIRDCNGARALETLVRYRGTVLAELFRALGALKALQAQDSLPDNHLRALPSTMPKTKQTRESEPTQELSVLAMPRSAS